MKAVTAGIFSAPIAAESTNRKISQNTTSPISADGLAPGLILSTYWPLCPESRAWSSLALRSSLVTISSQQTIQGLLQTLSDLYGRGCEQISSSSSVAVGPAPVSERGYLDTETCLLPVWLREISDRA